MSIYWKCILLAFFPMCYFSLPGCFCRFAQYLEPVVNVLFFLKTTCFLKNAFILQRHWKTIILPLSNCTLLIKINLFFGSASYCFAKNHGGWCGANRTRHPHKPWQTSTREEKWRKLMIIILSFIDKAWPQFIWSYYLLATSWLLCLMVCHLGKERRRSTCTSASLQVSLLRNPWKQ